MYTAISKEKITKYWNELRFALTEDENGHVRTVDFKELGGMMVDEFFALLEIYEERIAKRAEAIKNVKNKKPPVK